MKRLIAILLLFMLVIGMLPLSALAANDAYILAQPQNYVYNEGAVAIYSVTVAGENLKCTWYLEYQGETYDLSNISMDDPWLSYVVGDCGSAEEQDNLGFAPSHTTFSYFFNGCEAGLNGAYIYAQIHNGQYSIQSDKAMIQLSAGAKSPPQVSVPAAVDVCKGDKVELTCSATAIYGGRLSYTWYETPDGDLTKIQAVNGGEETDATLVCDTNSYGMRYYVCAVEEEGGGFAYSSVIPVMVMESQPTTSDPESTEKPTEPTDTTEPVTEPATESTAETTTEPATESTTETTTEPTSGQDAQQPAEDATEGGNMWLYVGIGLGVLAVGMLVAIILLLKPKKKSGK